MPLKSFGFFIVLAFLLTTSHSQTTELTLKLSNSTKTPHFSLINRSENANNLFFHTDQKILVESFSLVSCTSKIK